MNVLHKGSILKKTSQISGLTLMSRFFGVVREMLMIRYLGAGVMAEAFITAFKLPNTMRKLFAEGALSVAFIPTLVKLVKEKGTEQASSVMTLACLLFEGLVLLLCGFIIWQTPLVVGLLLPGWPAEKSALAVPLLRVLMPFILFLSTNALLTGALQAMNHFFVPAFSPIVLNSVFILGIMICMYFSLPVVYLCMFIVLAAAVTSVGYLLVYFSLGFSFPRVTKDSWIIMKSVLAKFLPCILTVGFLEFMFLISTTFASYLPEGSIALVYYANRFMGIPLGVFATAFSTILLPHFSRVATYAPKRLSFYFLETTKFVMWITVPTSLLMIFFSEKIFTTILLSDKFTPAHAAQASSILIAYASGIFFFSLNKILPTIYYAFHVTWIPAVASLAAGIINIALDLILMNYYQAVGLAMAYTVAAILQVTVLACTLQYFGLRLYIQAYANFVARYLVQLALTAALFLQMYYVGVGCIAKLPSGISKFALEGIGLWLWVGPLCALLFLCLYATRALFGIKLHFLDS